MFAGGGAKHRHEDGVECECLDAYDFFQQMLEKGMPLDPEDYEPEATQFPGLEIEEALGIAPHIPATTLEAWLWKVWSEIRRGVALGGFGPGKITWSDLQAYQSFSGLVMSDWLVKTILEIDGLFLMNYKMKEKS